MIFTDIDVEALRMMLYDPIKYSPLTITEMKALLFRLETAERLLKERNQNESIR